MPGPLSYDNSGEPDAIADTSDVPDAVKALRDDPARKMFSPQKTYANALPEAPDWTDAQRAQAREFREVFCDVGLSEPEAGSDAGAMRTLRCSPTASM